MDEAKNLVYTLRFGIPSLDRLLGSPLSKPAQEGNLPSADLQGIALLSSEALPSEEADSGNASTAEIAHQEYWKFNGNRWMWTFRGYRNRARQLESSLRDALEITAHNMQDMSQLLDREPGTPTLSQLAQMLEHLRTELEEIKQKEDSAADDTQKADALTELSRRELCEEIARDLKVLLLNLPPASASATETPLETHNPAIEKDVEILINEFRSKQERLLGDLEYCIYSILDCLRVSQWLELQKENSGTEERKALFDATVWRNLLDKIEEAVFPDASDKTIPLTDVPTSIETAVTAITTRFTVLQTDVETYKNDWKGHIQAVLGKSPSDPDDKAEIEKASTLAMEQADDLLRYALDRCTSARFNRVTEGRRGQRLGGVSVCIAGSSGVGKSALALHLAARYAADSFSDNSISILYASTDLSYEQAKNTWDVFGLENQKDFHDPFKGYDDLVRRPRTWKAPEFPEKVKLHPLGVEQTAAFIVSPQKPCRRVGFINLQSETAGDDWQFLNRTLAELPPRSLEEPAHLLIIDAIEGLETLAGSQDSYGMLRTRRSRVAQIVRTAGAKCHLVFIVEGTEETDHPEKFIADAVLRLRTVQSGEHLRRSLEVEKVRGQAHVRGQHPLLIRDGRGSTTGAQDNPDDPLHSKSYIHVVPSLNFVTRSIMWHRGGWLPEPPAYHVADFGIRHLDDMLREASPSPNEGGSREEYPRLLPGEDLERGLPSGTVTALTGDDGTQKTRLGKAFAGRNFAPYVRCYKELLEAFLTEIPLNPFEPYNQPAVTENPQERASSAVRMPEEWKKKYGIDFNTDPNHPAWERTAWWKRRFPHLYLHFAPEENQALRDEYGKGNPSSAEQRLFALVEEVLRPEGKTGAELPPEERIFAASVVLQELIRFERRASVYITTQDLDAQGLARSFVRHLSRGGRRWRNLPIAEEKRATCIPLLEQGLVELLQHRIVCRRLENHDLSTAHLFHIVRQCVRKAQTIIMPPLEGNYAEYNKTDVRFKKGWRIRVVIEDWRVIEDTYSDVRRDAIFLPFLLFYLRREGVTTLVVHTYPGQPEVLKESHEDTLQTLANFNLRTWRIHFKDEDRVAIAAIPPVATDMSSAIRELKWESNQADETLTVDPSLELYQGLQEGRPELTPLRIRLNGESPAFLEYARIVNRSLHEKFPGAKAKDIVVSCEDADSEEGSGASYENLRDLCHLQGEARLDHSLVFMVDEFWVVPDQERDTLHSSRLRSQKRYLNTITWDMQWGPATAIDVNGIFQRDQLRVISGNVLRRHDFFQPEMLPRRIADATGRDRPKIDLDALDRIPFTMNFSFLLCRRNAWELAREEPLPTLTKSTGKTIKVGEVWTALRKHSAANTAFQDSGKKPTEVEANIHSWRKSSEPLSWRAFLEACQIIDKVWSVRQGNITAFDLSRASAESLSCLVLEMWASEIVNDLETGKLSKLSKESLGLTEWQPSLTHRAWLQGSQGPSLIRWLAPDDWEVAGRNTVTKSVEQAFLIEPTRVGPSFEAGKSGHPWTRFPGATLQLYRVLALLSEVLSEESIRQTTTNLFSDKESRERINAAATREWFTTASIASQLFDPNDPMIPCALPGRFALRGDWFLAVARGSRSQLLADQVLDMLSSGTGNITRLRMGIGLPTRWTRAGRYDTLPTPLRTVDELPTNQEIKDRISALSPGENSENNEGLAQLFHPFREPTMRTMTYRDVMSMGPIVTTSSQNTEAGGDEEQPDTDATFHYFWRSSLVDYDRHARIWQRWLVEELTRFIRIRQVRRAAWSNGFEVYDALCNIPFTPGDNLSPEQKAERQRALQKVVLLESFRSFGKQVDELVRSLKAATPWRPKER